jgi:hypothetical protein
MSGAEELAEVARLMVEHRLDSVKMPSGLEVLKTTHAPFELPDVAPELLEEAVERRLEAEGMVNATGESGRVPVEQEGMLFVASKAPALRPEDFRPIPEQPVSMTGSTWEEFSDADADE